MSDSQAYLTACRDSFAKEAMKVILTRIRAENGKLSPEDFDLVAANAYDMADTMMEVRDRASS